MSPKTFLLGVSISILAVINFACKDMAKDATEEGKAIARVGEEYLYEDDILKLIDPEMSSQDSNLMVTSYVDNWITQQLILQKAEQSLSENQKNVSKELNEYRNSLLRYKYEQEIIRNFLDTAVSEEAIEQYYTNNQRNFLLKENIVKAIFVKVSKDAPKLKKLRSWYKSNRDEDRVALAEFCHQYAMDFSLDDEDWIAFEQILRKVPIRTYNQEQFLQSNKFVELKDSLGIYFVNIKSFKIKESVSPLEFERENIRNLIINKRKRNLITKMEEDIYQGAVKNKKFEIYADN